jgi:hypothetical protein
MLSPCQLETVGVSDLQALASAELQPNSATWEKLHAFFEDPASASRRHNLTISQACAGNYVIDMQNSLSWMHLSSSGCAPTVTCSHNKNSILILKVPVCKSRFLLPEEHWLLQGFDLKDIRAISLGVNGSQSTIGCLAGNAIALPVMECLVEALSGTYPEVFKERRKS